MAVQKKKPAPAASKSKYVITQHEVNIRSVNRSPKDIASWVTAHKTAEAILTPNRVLLYDLYETVRLDGHLSGIISKRWDDVLNKELVFKKGDTVVEQLNDLIDSEKFRGIIKEILETKLYGITGLEFIPGPELQYLKMYRKHIKPHIGIYATEQYGTTGFDYETLPNMWVIGEKDDLGLLLKCSPYAIYKKGCMADWAQYVEIFGMPVRVIKYDAYDTQTKIELKKTLDESGSALAVMIPNQANFEMMDGKMSNGDGKLQETFKQSLNNEMSILILGNTETTSNDNGGSNAKSQTHEEEQLKVTKSDLKYVQNFLNDPEFITILRSYGYPVDGGKFEFAKEIDLDTVKTQIAIVQSVKTMGTPVDDDYIYDITGIPKPKDYDAQKKKGEQEKLAQQKAAMAGPKNSLEDITVWEKVKSFFA